MGDAIRVLFLVEGAPGEPESPASTFRVGSYLPHFKAAGIEATIRPARPNKYRNGPPGAAKPVRALTFTGYNLLRTLRRVRDALDAADFDAVFLQRELLPAGPPWIERMIARRNPRIVFDLDDAVYLPMPFPFGMLTPRGRAAEIAGLARIVTAGNAVLAEWARAHCTDVRIVPTGVDTDLFRPRPRRARDVPRVGWIGQPGNLHELERIAPALRAAHRQQPFRMAVVTRLPASARLDGLDVEWIDYTNEAHPQIVADLDVALMPLKDSPWDRGKCGAKLLFAMASGIPVVASPVGANRDIVTDGETGYHATSDSEWTARLAALVADPASRARMGAAARRAVEERYSLRALLPRVLDALHDVRTAPAVRRAAAGA